MTTGHPADGPIPPGPVGEASAGQGASMPARDDVTPRRSLAGALLEARRGPAQAVTDPETGSRFYDWGGETFWSVTTIISGGVPKHLQNWAAKSVAELAYSDVTERGKRALRAWERSGRADLRDRQALGQLRSIKPDRLTPRDFALRWLKGAPDRIRDAARDRGSDIHAASEDLVLAYAREAVQLIIADDFDEPSWPDEIVPYMANGFLAWVRDFRPRFLASEFTIYHRAQKYAGTGDTVVDIVLPKYGPRAQRVLIDYKSGNRIYPEVALQLAALRRGEFIGLPDGLTEAPMLDVDLTAVLHIRPNGYAFLEVDTSEPVFNAFLYAREVYRFRDVMARTVIGEAIDHA